MEMSLNMSILTTRLKVPCHQFEIQFEYPEFEPPVQVGDGGES